MYEHTGEKIRQLRKQVGMSQIFLAKDVCSQSEISRVERGLNEPSYQMLWTISKKFGVDINYFLDEASMDREDYFREVKELLEKARRDRDYKFIEEIVDQEAGNPLLQKGNRKRYLKWHKGMVVYHLYNKADEAVTLFLQCLSNSDLDLLITELDMNVLNSVGIIKRNEGELNEAVYYFEKALQVLDRMASLRKERIVRKIYYNLSKVHTDLEEHEQSIDYCEKGRILCIHEEDMFLFAEFHYQLGRNHLLLGNEEEGLDYWEKAKNVIELQQKTSLLKFIEKELETYRLKGIVE
ncbi:helix-turn-helix domain-containing protein [Salimicrobium flavidum]|uniref:Transcriptional regulator, contains XRE-family HTH domain n=1 Tax=Salimicrobium flavidum TaxID=570947 RepID=A0A1N7ISH5_9BACI|nr:helix-turn-helix domain-containing protein [Salimicrobium flavidum]SIS40048.1 Transcriptional regulator, contains XRE-family HTH domain [Salimicrobium flavidum]